MTIRRKRISHSINESINYEAVCRTAPASPGLLKIVEQSTHICIRGYVQVGSFESSDLRHIFMQKKLESVNFSVTNGTFVTKCEFESNFLTTPTDEPKFNHWVKTTLNQLMLQFEPFSRCI